MYIFFQDKKQLKKICVPTQPEIFRSVKSHDDFDFVNVLSSLLFSNFRNTLIFLFGLIKGQNYDFLIGVTSLFYI